MTTSFRSRDPVVSSRDERPACEREPIHIPGSVQPHGVLLVLRMPDLVLVQASSNAAEAFGRPLDQVLGRPLASVFDARPLALDPMPREDALATRNPIAVAVSGRPYDAILHRSGARLVMELEPATPADEAARLASRDVYHRLQHALSCLRAAASTAELFTCAAREVRALTGFDRVMIYRFEPDDHGVVVAESRREDLPSYVGLHYPASDVPAPARQLYAKNPLRIIPDTRYEAAPLVPTLDPETGAPLDMSSACLRSVSRAHLEYLENMGVRASMSISLRERARLWGLVACHHQTPHFVAYETRLACELFGDVIAGQTLLLEQRERAQARARVSEVLVQVVHAMSARGIREGLLEGDASVLDLVDAGGAALCREATCATIGSAPSEADAAHLVRWLRESGAFQKSGIWHTDSLGREWAEGAALKDVAAGVLAISFSDEADHVLFWCRPERPRTVRWGGDPRFPRHGPDRRSPRGSFQAWVERARLVAAPWTEVEVEIAAELRSAILDIVMRNAAELARLNAELRQAVRARDEFLSMASHELRTPLATLVLQVDSLTRLASVRTDVTLASERVGRSLSTTRRQLGRLEQLVTEMLDVSRLSAGRLELRPEPGVDLVAVVREVLVRFGDKLAGIEVDVRAQGDLVGTWDASRLDQVVTNLVSNAIKYGNARPIRIEMRGEDEHVVLVVRDEGLGLSEEDQRGLFSRFHRAPSNERRYSGFGLGLWIVKLFVEAHGGDVAVESAPGQGASFRVRLPREARACRIEPKVV